MELKSLLDQPSKLPTIPKVTQQLLKSFGSEDASVHDIAHQLVADPVLSAKLLRLANSAYFNFSRTIGTVDEALQMLGFVMVRNLVLGGGMSAAFRNTPGMNLNQFWRYNLYTASVGRWLATRADADGDSIFTVGLLHAIGQLHLHAVAPAEVLPLDKQMSVLHPERAALENKTFGFHYGDVSAELATLWKLPPTMIEALRLVPDPLSAQTFSDMAGWVHMGAWRARAEVTDLSAQDVMTDYPQALAQKLGLDPAWVTEMPPLQELTAGLDALIA